MAFNIWKIVNTYLNVQLVLSKCFNKHNKCVVEMFEKCSYDKNACAT